MFECRGCQQCIHRWHWLIDPQPAPTIGNSLGNCQQPVTVFPFKAFKPFFQGGRGCFISPADPFKASSDFPQSQDTEINVTAQLCFEPCPNAAGSSDTLAQLADNICVQEKAAHRSASRGRSFTLEKSLAVPASGIERRKSLNELLPPLLPNRASRKIRLCSSSAETPWRPARSFSLRTTFSSISLTINCGISCYQ